MRRRSDERKTSENNANFFFANSQSTKLVLDDPNPSSNMFLLYPSLYTNIIDNKKFKIK